MALQALAKFRNALQRESTFSIIWDSGTSISISPNKDDLVGHMTSPGIGTCLKGIIKGLSIQGKGHGVEQSSKGVDSLAQQTGSRAKPYAIQHLGTQ
jgi:hypothetical protein